MRGRQPVERWVTDPTWSPRVLGPYVVHDEIASGALGTVHFARFTDPSGFRRTVVAKRPHSLVAQSSDFALMMMDEARLAARIHHPNVVPTLDVLQTPTDLLLVMDYVHGESLYWLADAANCGDERIPLPIATAIIVDVLHGLHAAHEATDEHGQPLGIVHRDVSPQNILVGVDGIARLIDFGIAKAARRLQAETKAKTVKGKYGYMAPEQATGGAVTRRTDTFAAAIVYWEMLTGEPLFIGKNDAETVHKSLLARIQRPSKIAAGVPPEIDDIVRKALAREPAYRYPTAREMALDIENCIPPIPRSEIGSWVERMASGTLAERAAILAKIEREGAGV
jgi:eukaryotic-like serine/threonine-protein kinase